MARITIDSILGGHSPTTHFATKDQFRASFGIDPGSPISVNAPFGVKPSGVLRPVRSLKQTGTLGATPLWIQGARGTTTVFIYDSAGSAYTYTPPNSTFTALADAGALTGAQGNGMAYYDNYLYFAKNTNITRYGPLDGTPGWQANYWTTTLGKAALSDIYYPLHSAGGSSSNLPNHFLYRHSNGRLYIADTTNNQGTIHYISTTKTTVEGDTDNGSTANALTFGFGLVPTCMESYGSNLVIALYERDITGNGSGRDRNTRAKVAFWDTTSGNFNSITWVEFPDPLITAMKNVNGILYAFSAISEQSNGYRVTQYVGGSTFKEVWSSEDGTAPFPGAIDGTAERLVFGSQTTIPSTVPCVFSLGLQADGLSNGLFCPHASESLTTGAVTSLLLFADNTRGKRRDYPIYGIGNFAATFALEGGTSGSGALNSAWWSQQYNIGQPFQIKRIRIPLVQTLTAGMQVTPKLYFDNGTLSQTLTAITPTNFPSTGPGNGIVANIRTAGDGTNILMGQTNFWLELIWAGTTECYVDLPIIIDFEIIPD